MIKVQMIHARCEDILHTFPDDSVDMVLADLPYGTTRCKWDTPLDLDWLWGEYRRVCRGAILLFAQTPFDKVLGASNLDMLRYEWIWEKSHPTGHLNARKMPMKSHENILVFYERLPTYNPQMTFNHARKTAKKRGDGSPIYGAQSSDIPGYDSTSRFPRSVLQFPSDKQTSNHHNTQKPLALCEYLIKTYTNQGDTVLDNVMGSGTTIVAALLNGRSAIGIEKDGAIFDKAMYRLGNDVPSAAHHGISCRVVSNPQI